MKILSIIRNSYPFSEDEINPKSYMTTRCPSWCDRILLNPDAKKLIQISDENPVKYEMIGLDSCVGDHKVCFHICIAQFLQLKFFLFT